jgi:hypothetical protein
MNKVIATKEIYLRIIDFAYTGEYSLSFIFNKMKYLSHSIRSFRCMNQHNSHFTFICVNCICTTLEMKWPRCLSERGTLKSHCVYSLEISTLLEKRKTICAESQTDFQ